MGKIITGAIVGLVVILAVLVGIFYFNLDKVIIAAVEKYGSEVTKSDVTLNEVDLDLTSGNGALRGLSVSNPSGFEEPSAFELGEIAVSVDMSATGEELIHIKEIKINAPQITYELNETTNNLDTIKQNIDNYIKENGLDGGDQKQAADEEEGPKLIIDKLTISNGKVTVKAPITLNKKIEGNLPTIQLTDIGKDSGGATPGEVAAQVADKVTSGAMGVVAGLGVGKTLESLGAGVTGAAEAVGKGVTGAAGGAGKAVEGAAGAVKNLLK